MSKMRFLIKICDFMPLYEMQMGLNLILKQLFYLCVLFCVTLCMKLCCGVVKDKFQPGLIIKLYIIAS